MTARAGDIVGRFEIRMHAERAHAIAERMRDAGVALRAKHSLATYYNAACDYAEAVRQGNLAIGKARVKGACDSDYLAYLLRNVGVIHAKAGNDSYAQKLVEEGRQTSDADAPETFIRRAEVHMLAGRLGEAERDFSACQGLSGAGLQSGILQAIGMRLWGAHLCLSGRHEEGLAVLSEASEAALSDGYGHQASKIEDARRAFDSSRFRRFLGRGGTKKMKRGETPDWLKRFL